MARMGLSKKVSTVPKKETQTKAKPAARNIFLNQSYTTKPTCFLCNIKQDPISFAWSTAVVYALERLLREGLSPSMDNLEQLIKTEIILVKVCKLRINMRTRTDLPLRPSFRDYKTHKINIPRPLRQYISRVPHFE